MEVEIERTLVGRVMGPGGATINAIRSEVGCVLDSSKMRVRAAASSSLRAARSSSRGAAEGGGAPGRPPPPRGCSPGREHVAPRGTRKTPEQTRRDAAAGRLAQQQRLAAAPPPPPAPAPAPPPAPPPPSPSRRRPRPSQEYQVTVAPRDAQVLLGLPGLKEEARRAGVRLQTEEDDDGWLHLTLRGSAAAIAAAKAKVESVLSSPPVTPTTAPAAARAAVDPADGVAYTRDEFVAEYGGTREWDAAKRGPRRRRRRSRRRRRVRARPAPPSALRRGTATAATTAASLATRTRTSRSWCEGRVASTRS